MNRPSGDIQARHADDSHGGASPTYRARTSILARAWRPAAWLVLLLGVDLAISLPIMGATYRPMGWMSLAPADTETLYPVIQELSFDKDGRPSVAVAVTPGACVVLSRSTNLLAGDAWIAVAATTAMTPVVALTDTNPLPNTAFYRVGQTADPTP